MHFLKSYSKFTIILKVNKLLPKETKHKIKGLFVLNKHLFDVIKIKKSNKLNIKYFNDKNKPIKIFDDKLKECLLYLNNKFKININYEIVITKYIPLRSGLGGSATNAGTLIKYLCSKNKINLKSLDLKYIALNFGSDIPFFLFEHQNAIVSNYGDKVKKIKLNDINYKLFLSKYSFTSQQIFKLLDSNKKYKSRVNFNECLKKYQNKIFKTSIIYNDLQPYVLESNPNYFAFFNNIKKRQNNILMSGSGGSIINISYVK